MFNTVKTISCKCNHLSLKSLTKNVNFVKKTSLTSIIVLHGKQYGYKKLKLLIQRLVNFLGAIGDNPERTHFRYDLKCVASTGLVPRSFELLIGKTTGQGN